MRRGALGLILLATAACSTRAPNRVIDAPRRDADAGPVVRVAITAPNPTIGGTEAFGWYDESGRTLIARGRPGEQWQVQRDRGANVRAVRPDGVVTEWRRALVARPLGGGYIALGGRRYRGELRVLQQDAQFVFVNHVRLEDYLRGVVAVEMGARPRGDSAAVQAQAVASRSFVLNRMRSRDELFDVRASVSDQAYGGLEVENAVANAAVERTAGLVLRYNGRVADALYSSTCGGTTAEADEVWRTGGVAYLRRVSDQVPNSDRFYCDIAPRYRWSRELSGTELNEALARYLADYSSTKVPDAGPGAARALDIAGRTESGRVATLDVRTERGTFPVRANDIRYVVRAPGGEMLPSTYFSVESQQRDAGGRLTHVTLRGRGYGHGVGMCQWGAIGRARAGQSFRAILATYYPGTSIGAIE